MERHVFVARERELGKLDRFLDGALAAQGQVCFVSGEAGSGKTALVAEFARRAQQAHADLVVAIGNCNAHTGVGDPYLPFREVLSLLTGDVEAKLAQGAITQENASRLRAFLVRSGQVLIEVGPDLLDLLVPGSGLIALAGKTVAEKVGWLDELERLARRKQERPDAAKPAIDQSRIFEQYTNVLMALAAQQPMMLVLDDLQWADAASISLLFHLGRRIGGGRILIVGAYRPDEVALGRRGERHPLEKVLAEFKRYFGDVWVDLDQTAETEGRQFVDAFLDAEPNRLGDDFRQALLQHTRGHPLFTIELLHNMQERGDLVRDEARRWIEGSELDWRDLPPRVEGVIEERIGRLEEELRDALTVGSVEGKDFTAQVVARVQSVDERGLVRRLSDELDRQHRLVAAQGIRRAGQQRLSVYSFRHSLFQMYLYDGLDAVERAYLHEDVGNALEALYGDQVQDVAVQLAWHYDEAGIAGKAIDYLLQAGDGARRVYANEDAIEHYRRALALLEDTPADGFEEDWRREVAARLHEGLGDILALTGEHDEARVAYQGALSQLPRHDPVRQAGLHRKIGGTCEGQRCHEEALQAYDVAEITLGEEPAEPALAWWQEWIEIQVARIWTHYWSETQAREMVELAEKAQPAVEQYGTPAQRGSYYQCLVAAGNKRNRFVVSDETVAHARASLEASQESDDLGMIAHARFSLGFCHLWHGDLEEAEEELQASLALAERTGDVVLQRRCLVYLTIVHRKRGEVEETRRLIPRSLAAATGWQAFEYDGNAKANQAWVAWREGDLTEARLNGQAALELWQPSVTHPFRWLALWPLIGVAMAQDQLREAVEYAHALLEPEQQRLPQELTTAIEDAIQAWAEGELEAARTHLSRALELAQEKGYL